MKKNKKLYLIKSLAPWMMEELITFSKFTKFTIIFLREVPEFYNDDLKTLQQNGIEYMIKPFKFKIDIAKSFYLTWFWLKNIFKFTNKTNIFWLFDSSRFFCLLDKNTLKQFDTIHAQFASQAALVALFAKEMYKKEYYFTFHAHDIYFSNKWFPSLVNNSECSFSISQFNIQYIQKAYKNINIDKVKLCRLGVRLPEDYNRNATFEKKQLRFMSNLEEKKGIPYLLDAFKILTDKYPDKYELTIAGSGDYMPQIEAFVKTNKLENSVNLLGRIRDQKKQDFFKNIDVFILPAIMLKDDMDGIPVVLMEAISFAKPIVSTDVSGIPEICINEKVGYLIEERKVNQIVEAIEKVFQSEENYEKFSKNARKLAEDEYDLIQNSKRKLESMGWV